MARHVLELKMRMQGYLRIILIWALLSAIGVETMYNTDFGLLVHLNLSGGPQIDSTNTVLRCYL